MAFNLLDMLRKKDPNMTLEDARSAMGMSPQTNFDAMGNFVPTQDDTPEPVPLFSPMAKPVPAEPQIYNEGYDPVAALDIEPGQSLAPAPIVKKGASVLPSHLQKQAEKEVDDEDKKLAPSQEEMGDKYGDEPKESPEDKKFLDQHDKEQKEALATPTLADRFKAAQQSQANAQDAAIWSKIGAKIGGALGHQSKDVIKGNEDLADAIATRGGRPMQQLQQEIAFQKEDPNSDYSKKAKDFLSEQFGIDPIKLEGLSVEQLDKTFMGPALKAFEAQQTRESKETIAEENRLSREQAAKDASLSRENQARIASQERELKNKELNIYRDKMLGDRNQRFYEGQLKSVVNKAMAPVNNADKLNETRLYNSSNIFMTAGIDPDSIKSEHDIEKLDRKELDKVPIPQVVELGIEAAKALGGGNPAVSTINKLVPNNVNMTQAQIAGYITSELKPAQQADVIKAYMKLAHRLRETSKSHIKKRLDAAFSGNEKIKSFNPDDYEAAKEATYSKYGLSSSKKENSNKLMDKIPNAADLDKTFESIDTMSEDDLDKELARRGLK